MIISLTMACIVVVTFALTFRPALALVCEEQLLGFQLKFPYLFTDLGEALLGGLVVEVCHLRLVVDRVVMARMFNR